MKSNKQKTFEEWMSEEVARLYGYRGNSVAVKRKGVMSFAYYNFAKEVWAAAGGKFKSDEVSDSE